MSSSSEEDSVDRSNRRRRHSDELREIKINRTKHRKSTHLGRRRGAPPNSDTDKENDNTTMAPSNKRRTRRSSQSASQSARRSSKSKSRGGRPKKSANNADDVSVEERSNVPEFEPRGEAKAKEDKNYASEDEENEEEEDTVTQSADNRKRSRRNSGNGGGNNDEDDDDGDEEEGGDNPHDGSRAGAGDGDESADRGDQEGRNNDQGGGAADQFHTEIERLKQALLLSQAENHLRKNKAKGGRRKRLREMTEEERQWQNMLRKATNESCWNVVQFCNSDKRLVEMTKRAMHHLKLDWLNKETGRKLEKRIALFVAKNKDSVRTFLNDIRNYQVSVVI